MALYSPKYPIFLSMACLTMALLADAGDPDLLSDFLLPPNTATVNASFFTHTALRGLINGPPPPVFKVTKASLVEFPALNGQGVSYAVLQFPAASVNPPHTHPRAAELLFLLHGCLKVGLVDTTNMLFTQTLKAGDLFVFPKGLVHFQFNADPKYPAVALSAFGSANAGTVPLPIAIFATGIDDVVLAKSFKTDVATIKKLKAGLAIKP